MKSKCRWYYVPTFKWIIQKYRKKYCWWYKYAKQHAYKKKYCRKRNKYCNYRKCLPVYKYFWHNYWHYYYVRRCWKRKTKKYRRTKKRVCTHFPKKCWVKSCKNFFTYYWKTRCANKTYNKRHRKSIRKCKHYPKYCRNAGCSYYYTNKCSNHCYKKRFPHVFKRCYKKNCMCQYHTNYAGYYGPGGKFSENKIHGKGKKRPKYARCPFQVKKICKNTHCVHYCFKKRYCYQPKKCCKYRICKKCKKCKSDNRKWFTTGCAPGYICRNTIKCKNTGPRKCYWKRQCNTRCRKIRPICRFVFHYKGQKFNHKANHYGHLKTKNGYYLHHYGNGVYKHYCGTYCKNHVSFKFRRYCERKCRKVRHKKCKPYRARCGNYLTCVRVNKWFWKTYTHRVCKRFKHTKKNIKCVRVRKGCGYRKHCFDKWRTTYYYHHFNVCRKLKRRVRRRQRKVRKSTKCRTHLKFCGKVCYWYYKVHYRTTRHRKRRCEIRQYSRRVKRPHRIRKRKCLRYKAICGKIKHCVKKNIIRHRLRKICYNKSYTRPHTYKVGYYKTHCKTFKYVCNRKCKFYYKWITGYTWKYKPHCKRVTTRRRHKRRVATKVTKCKKYSAVCGHKCAHYFKTLYRYKWYVHKKCKRHSYTKKYYRTKRWRTKHCKKYKAVCGKFCHWYLKYKVIKYTVPRKVCRFIRKWHWHRKGYKVGYKHCKKYRHVCGNVCINRVRVYKTVFRWKPSCKQLRGTKKARRRVKVHKKRCRKYRKQCGHYCKYYWITVGTRYRKTRVCRWVQKRRKHRMRFKKHHRVCKKYRAVCGHKCKSYLYKYWKWHTYWKPVCTRKQYTKTNRKRHRVVKGKSCKRYTRICGRYCRWLIKSERFYKYITTHKFHTSCRTIQKRAQRCRAITRCAQSGKKNYCYWRNKRVFVSKKCTKYCGFTWYHVNVRRCGYKHYHRCYCYGCGCACRKKKCIAKSNSKYKCIITKTTSGTGCGSGTCRCTKKNRCGPGQLYTCSIPHYYLRGSVKVHHRTKVCNSVKKIIRYRKKCGTKKCHKLIWKYYKKCYPRRSFCKYHKRVRRCRSIWKHHRKCWSYLHPVVVKYNIPYTRRYCRRRSKACHRRVCTGYWYTYYKTRCYNVPYKAKHYYTYRHCLRNIKYCAYNKCHYKYHYGYKTYFKWLRKRYCHTKQIKVGKYKRVRKRRCRQISRICYSRRCANVVRYKHVPHYVTRLVRKCRNVPHITRKRYSVTKCRKYVNYCSRSRCYNKVYVVWKTYYKTYRHRVCKRHVYRPRVSYRHCKTLIRRCQRHVCRTTTHRVGYWHTHHQRVCRWIRYTKRHGYRKRKCRKIAKWCRFRKCRKVYKSYIKWYTSLHWYYTSHSHKKWWLYYCQGPRKFKQRKRYCKTVQKRCRKTGCSVKPFPYTYRKCTRKRHRHRYNKKIRYCRKYWRYCYKNRCYAYYSPKWERKCVHRNYKKRYTKCYKKWCRKRYCVRQCKIKKHCYNNRRCWQTRKCVLNKKCCVVKHCVMVGHNARRICHHIKHCKWKPHCRNVQRCSNFRTCKRKCHYYRKCVHKRSRCGSYCKHYVKNYRKVYCKNVLRRIRKTRCKKYRAKCGNYVKCYYKYKSTWKWIWRPHCTRHTGVKRRRVCRTYQARCSYPYCYTRFVEKIRHYNSPYYRARCNRIRRHKRYSKTYTKYAGTKCTNHRRKCGLKCYWYWYTHYYNKQHRKQVCKVVPRRTRRFRTIRKRHCRYVTRICSRRRVCATKWKLGRPRTRTICRTYNKTRKHRRAHRHTKRHCTRYRAICSRGCRKYLVWYWRTYRSIKTICGRYSVRVRTSRRVSYSVRICKKYGRRCTQCNWYWLTVHAGYRYVSRRFCGYKRTKVGYKRRVVTGKTRHCKRYKRRCGTYCRWIRKRTFKYVTRSRRLCKRYAHRAKRRKCILHRKYCSYCQYYTKTHYKTGYKKKHVRKTKCARVKKAYKLCAWRKQCAKIRYRQAFCHKYKKRVRTTYTCVNYCSHYANCYKFKLGKRYSSTCHRYKYGTKTIIVKHCRWNYKYRCGCASVYYFNMYKKLAYKHKHAKSFPEHGKKPVFTEKKAHKPPKPVYKEHKSAHSVVSNLLNNSANSTAPMVKQFWIIAMVALAATIVLCAAIGFMLFKCFSKSGKNYNKISSLESSSESDEDSN